MKCEICARLKFIYKWTGTPKKKKKQERSADIDSYTKVTQRYKNDYNKCIYCFSTENTKNP